MTCHRTAYVRRPRQHEPQKLSQTSCFLPYSPSVACLVQLEPTWTMGTRLTITTLVNRCIGIHGQIHFFFLRRHGGSTFFARFVCSHTIVKCICSIEQLLLMYHSLSLYIAKAIPSRCRWSGSMSFTIRRRGDQGEEKAALKQHRQRTSQTSTSRT